MTMQEPRHNPQAGKSKGKKKKHSCLDTALVSHIAPFAYLPFVSSQRVVLGEKPDSPGKFSEEIGLIFGHFFHDGAGPSVVG